MANDHITMRVDGISKLRKDFEKLEFEGRRRVARATNLNALEYQKAVRKTIARITGRHKGYKRGNKTHWSSTPSRPPNSDTGNLRKMLHVTRIATSSRGYAYVRSGAKYSKALEFAKDRSRRRPFMLPMLRKKEKAFVMRIRKAIKGIL